MPHDIIRPKILIAGAGFSGTHALDTLVKSLRVPADIIVCDKDLQRVGGGIAYSGSTAEDFHQTNIAAKRMGLSRAFRDAVNPDQVASRRLVGAFLMERLAETTDEAKRKGMTIRFIQGEVTDLIEIGQGVKAKIEGIRDYYDLFDSAIVATGNSDLKRLPCINKHLMSDAHFLEHYIEDQWTKSSKGKIASIPKDAPVLILGTGLSSYDAVRSLLRNGHSGQITMMSRNGLEHFKYPENHTWPDVHLPRPHFMNLLSQPEKAKRAFIREFYDWTGIEVNLTNFTYRQRENMRSGPNKPSLLPEQVLKSWERFVPEIIDNLGIEVSSTLLARYSSLITVLRVGAGKEVCDEMAKAKANGQLFIIASDINGMTPTSNGVTVHYIPKSSAKPQCAAFHTVISALGYNFDYKKPKSELWQNLINRGYTSPHPLGIGVKASMDETVHGQLENSDFIYALGASVVGARMMKQGIIGPPAFSIPGTREITAKTAKAVAHQIEEEFYFKNPHMAFDMHPTKNKQWSLVR